MGLNINREFHISIQLRHRIKIKWKQCVVSKNIRYICSACFFFEWDYITLYFLCALLSTLTHGTVPAVGWIRGQSGKKTGGRRIRTARSETTLKNPISKWNVAFCASRRHFHFLRWWIATLSHVAVLFHHHAASNRLNTLIQWTAGLHSMSRNADEGQEVTFFFFVCVWWPICQLTVVNWSWSPFLCFAGVCTSTTTLISWGHIHLVRPFCSLSNFHLIFI